MHVIHRDDLLPECDRLDMPVPPVCPVWSVVVIDAVAHTVTDWLEQPVSLQRVHIDAAKATPRVAAHLRPRFGRADQVA